MAIAFDAAVDGTSNGGTGTLSFNHTVTGTNPLILTGFGGDVIGGADDITAVNFNSIAQTLLEKITVATSGDRITYCYGLTGQTGTHSVAVSESGSHLLQGGASSYSGVKQTGFLDNHTTNFSSAGALSLTTNITPSAANCWVVVVEGCYNSGAPPGAGTGATRRTFDATNGGWGIFDSNGPVTAGSPYSITTTRSSNPFSLAIVHVVISIAPDTGGGSPVTHFLSSLGCGA
jgi:hypothetical protein